MIAHDPCAGLQLLDQPWFQLQVDVGIEKQRDDRGVAEIGQKEVFVAKRYFVRQASRAGVRAGFCNAFGRSEEHTSELQSLMRISYAVFCLKKQTLNSQH